MATYAATAPAAGTCQWDCEIEEYVLVDVHGNAFYGATTAECHQASREASRARIEHAAKNGKE